MKIKYLGTAAAEAVPAPFCECEVCENARKKGGRNLRTRSQALVDGKLLIDFPMDTYTHTLQANFKLCKVEGCIITHPHYDHLFPDELYCRTKVAAHMKEEKPFCMYGVEETVEKIRTASSAAVLEKEDRLRLQTIAPFVPFTVGEYTVTPLKADHGTSLPVIYAVEKDGKALLYAHDTGLFPEETMEWLKNTDICFDFVSYDCTNGLLEWDNRNHMGLTGDVIMREKLKELGRIHDKTVHVVNHFSHNGLAGYDELAPVAEEKGFIVSYDGLEIEF